MDGDSLDTGSEKFRPFGTVIVKAGCTLEGYEVIQKPD